MSQISKQSNQMSLCILFSINSNEKDRYCENLRVIFTPPSLPPPKKTTQTNNTNTLFQGGYRGVARVKWCACTK